MRMRFVSIYLLMYSVGEKRSFRWDGGVVCCVIAFLAAVLSMKNVIGADSKPRLKKYCRERDRVITVSDDTEEYSNETDDYLLVDAEFNSTIVLECRFCGDESKDQPSRLWYWQDLNQTTEMTEVELGMDNNVTQIRVHMTAEYSLIIRVFLEEDVGIYRCIGEEDRENNRSLFNYRLEPVFDEESTNSTQRGNETEWKKYRDINLLPVTQLFANSSDEELLAIREEGVSLELVSEWGPWGPCEECVKKRGVKSRRAFCRIKSHFNEMSENTDDSEILQFFLSSPLLPCRSRILRERFPSVSNATRHLSEFVLTETCKHCKKEKKTKKHKFKYKKRYLLAEGAGLALPCPEATLLSDVVWRKESMVLPKGRGTSFRKKDPEPRVFVDPYFTLYLKDVSKYEQGNYSCSVDDTRMLQAKITVALHTRVGIKDLLRHLGYLGVIFLFTLVCYCYGIFRACKNRRTFRIQTYDQLMEEKQLLDVTY